LQPRLVPLHQHLLWVDEGLDEAGAEDVQLRMVHMVVVLRVDSDVAAEAAEVVVAAEQAWLQP